MHYHRMTAEELAQAAYGEARSPLESALLHALEDALTTLAGSDQAVKEAEQKQEEAEADVEKLTARVEELEDCCTAFRGMLRAWLKVFPGCPDDEAVDELVEDTEAALAEFPSDPSATASPSVR